MKEIENEVKLGDVAKGVSKLIELLNAKRVSYILVANLKNQNYDLIIQFNFST